MRWLITTTTETNLSNLRRRMARRGAKVMRDVPVPLGPDEQVLMAEGPQDLPDRLRDDPAIHGVHPDSELEFFG
jgi:hypothetical protein